jgi:NADH-quinone oxidoreductase subunit C
MADGGRAIERIRVDLPGAMTGSGEFRGQQWAVLRKEKLREACRLLRDDPALAYDFLVDVTAVHRPDDPEPFELVYHLYSTSGNDRVRLKVRLRDGEPAPTLADLWASADWNERETYDMFGIVFDGHPDPRRILMPDDYTDFPLRKEFPLYRG